jgi:hypothetical protein
MECLNDEVMLMNASAVATTTEIDILSQVIAPQEPSLQVELARSVLEMKFNENALEAIRKLLDKNNRGEITADEQLLLDKYLRVGQFIDLLQAKARLTLQESSQQ